MTMSTISINKLLKTSDNAGDKKNYLYLKTIWDDEKIIIKILDSESGKCYKGTLTTTAIEEKASDLGMSCNDYWEQIRLVLTTHMAVPGFYYKLEEDLEVVNIWKSQPDLTPDIPILFLDIDIKEIGNSTEILDSAVDLLHEKEEKLSERVEKAHKFDKHSRELLEDYRLCVEEKKELERKIFKKVSVLLNSKKEKILELENRLRKHEEVEINDDKSDADENETGPQTSKKRKLMVMDSESDSDYAAETQPLDLPNQQGDES